MKLRKIKRHKTYCIFWSEGSLTCYDAFNFKNAIGNRLDDELIILWNNAKNRLGKKAEFVHGGVTGTMTHIPHDLALSVFNAIKDRFANALKASNTKRKACCPTDFNLITGIKAMSETQKQAEAASHLTQELGL